MNVLEVKNVSKSYNNKKVLDNFSLAVREGRNNIDNRTIRSRKINTLKVYKWT